ncbi:MAG TPA: TIGR01777 family oxidoreductase [Nocardioides sp.]|nr:TIGR01777 family oxidoreductase [Nocardioides sp.]
MHVVVGGGSGFLGRHLTEALRARGHTTTSLTRREPTTDSESQWDPAAGRVDGQVIEDADVVVNAAGSPTIGNPHSKRWARNLRESRVTSTRTLAEAIAGSTKKPAFLAGNAVAVYGDHGDAPVTEAGDSRGHTLMADVTRVWEAAAQPAIAAGARVCVLRTSPVMDRESEPLRILRRLYRLGLGGRLGSGQQYFPMVSLRDWLAAVVFLAEHDTASGPVNICCPETPTNADFTRALAHAVGRPAFVPVPSPAIRITAGPLAPELLGSVNLIPQVLLDAGFEFRDRDAAAVVAAGLSGLR